MPYDLTRLIDNVARSNTKLKARLDMRKKLLLSIAGSNYAPEQNSKALPLNLMNQAVAGIMANVVHNDLDPKIRAETLQLRPYAKMLRLAVVKTLKEARYAEDALDLIVLDALTYMGIARYGIAFEGQVYEQQAAAHDAGAVFVDRVSPDDFFFEPEARQLSSARWMGHRYVVERQELLATGMVDPAVVEMIPEASQVGSGKGNYAEQTGEGVVDQVALMDVYTRYDNTISTYISVGRDHPIAIERALQAPLFSQPHEGLSSGPYRFLGFQWLPDHALPIFPAGIWSDLFDMVNELGRKAYRQAHRSKKLFLYTPAATDDAQRIAGADDGSAIQVKDPSQVAEFEMGGTTEDVYTFVEWAKRNFAEVSGNTNQLSGIKDESKTLGQAQMLQANAQVRVSDMQQAVDDFNTEITTAVAHLLHHHPAIQVPLQVTHPGLPPVDVMFTPEIREGGFFQFAFQVKTSPMTQLPPLEQAAVMEQFLLETIPRTMMVGAQLQGLVDVNGYLGILAELKGIRNFDEWWLGDPQQIQAVLMAGAQLQQAEGQAQLGPAGSRMQQGGQGGGQPRQAALSSGSPRQDAQGGPRQGQQARQPQPALPAGAMG